jgi:hypothetical protein
VDGTARLLDQARAAGVHHFIYISIVGIDQIGYSYYQHKLAAERLIEASGLSWSILRATQFHYLVDKLLHMLPEYQRRRRSRAVGRCCAARARQEWSPARHRRAGVATSG